MTEHPVELYDGDLPDQAGRADPFGLTYMTDPGPDDCTCDVEHIRHSTPGYPRADDGGWPILRTIRTADPDDPCPIPGHDLPAVT